MSRLTLTRARVAVLRPVVAQGAASHADLVLQDAAGPLSLAPPSVLGTSRAAARFLRELRAALGGLAAQQARQVVATAQRVGRLDAQPLAPRPAGQPQAPPEAELGRLAPWDVDHARCGGVGEEAGPRLQHHRSAT